jgi:predicted small integral membrane protein
MTLRVSKLLLVTGVAVFYTLVVVNNTTDYGSNYQLVRHVMMMDSTFPENHGMWRAVNNPRIHTAFYLSIIAWEILTALLGWWGAFRLASALRRNAAEFHQAKGMAIAALTLGLLMWLVAFLSVGGEWFLMWQSKNWNGQDAAFRMFTVIGIILLLLELPEAETQPRSSRPYF